MKPIILTLFTIFFLATSSCIENEKKETKKTTQVNLSENKEIRVQLEPKNNSGAIGKLRFNESKGIVKLEAKFMNLSPGIHAIHLHEKADCSSPDGKSAGGHWNPTFNKHGKWG
ncbi:MAG: superoxide dismutase family protein, partial [Flavobacteriaceae bacterium]|nr:superoxide dismutase family protein [Flavobacteriaceae bacterium]